MRTNSAHLRSSASVRSISGGDLVHPQFTIATVRGVDEDVNRSRQKRVTTSVAIRTGESCTPLESARRRLRRMLGVLLRERRDVVVASEHVCGVVGGLDRSEALVVVLAEGGPDADVALVADEIEP